MLEKLDKWLGRVEYATAWTAGVTIFALMFLASAEVLSRRLLNLPIPGQVDVTSLSMVAFSLLCISYCYRRAGHIRMDMLQKMTKGRVSRVTQLFATGVALFVVTAILPGTWTHFMRSWALGDSTIGVGLPTWPSKLAAPVGLGILWLRLVLEIWVYARLIADPDLEPIGLPRVPDPINHMDA